MSTPVGTTPDTDIGEPVAHMHQYDFTDSLTLRCIDKSGDDTISALSTPGPPHTGGPRT